MTAHAVTIRFMVVSSFLKSLRVLQSVKPADDAQATGGASVAAPVVNGLPAINLLSQWKPVGLRN
jgi:hypothetical protein